jgi:transketolase
MLAVGQEDENLIVMVGDISHGILQDYAAACPGRYYNIGICEPTIISMAAGLSRTGFHPVAHTIAPFLIERSFEQIKLDFCYHKLGGNLVTVGSAFDYSNLGSTHHCYGDFALIKTLQNTQIAYPATAVEFDQLFRQAYQNDYLTMYRVAGNPHNVEFDSSDIKLGQGIRVREGSDISLIATGPQLSSAMGAVDSLLDAGWDPEVIYIHTISPLDVGMIRASALKTGRMLIVEEHMEAGGLGDDVMRATRDMRDVVSESLAIPGRFVTGYGTYEEQCAQLGLTSEGIVSRVAEVFGQDLAKS